LLTTLYGHVTPVKLCCPSGQAYMLTGRNISERCEESSGPERACLETEDIPETKDIPIPNKQESRFTCKDGKTLVSIELFFGPLDFTITQNGSLTFEVEDPDKNKNVTHEYAEDQFCLSYTDIMMDYYDEDDSEGHLSAMYTVCFKEEEERGRIFTGVFYPTAIFISSVFIFITIIVYLYSIDIRSKLFGKITICFLLNVFVGYIFLGIHYSMNLYSNKEYLETPFCTVLGYIIQHTFIAFFFWMSAMALNVTSTFSNNLTVRSGSNQTKRLMFNILYAQGVPTLISIATILMDLLGPCDIVRPNMGKYSCFLGSEYDPSKSFFQSPVFYYFYLIIGIILISNIICFLVTMSSLVGHWWQMREFNTNMASQGLTSRAGIVLRLFIIMGIPWVCDFVSALIAYNDHKRNSFEFRLALDILNLLTGVLIFLTLTCKRDVFKSVRPVLSSAIPSFMSQSSNLSKKTVSRTSTQNSHLCSDELHS